MKIEQLQQALDRYGGDLRRWPEMLRAEAGALIAGDADAAELAAAAARLDGLLAEATRLIAVDAALIGRIIAGVSDGVHHEPLLRPTPRLAAWAGAVIIAFLTAGYAVGLALPASQGEDALAGLMFGNSQASDTASDTGSVL